MYGIIGGRGGGATLPVYPVLPVLDTLEEEAGESCWVEGPGGAVATVM